MLRKSSRRCASTALSDIDVLRWVRSRAHKNWKTASILIAVGFFSTLCAGISPFVIRQLVDYITRGQFPWSLALAAFILAGITMITSTCEQYIWQIKMREGAKNLALEVYAHVQTLPLSYFRENPTGGLMSKILSDTEVVGQVSVVYYPMLFLNLLQLVVSATVLFALEWRLAIAATALLLPAYFLLREFNWRLRKGWEEERVNYERVVERLREQIEGILVIKAFDRLQFFTDLFRQHIERWFSSLKHVLLYSQLARGVLSHLVSFLSVGFLVFGGVAAIKGWTSIGTVIAFFWYLGNLYAPIEGLVDWNNARQQLMPMGKRVLELLRLEPEKQQLGLPIPDDPTIILENVSAGYDGREVLHGVTAKFEYGKMTAIVGESGSGKSTLVSLVLGIMQPIHGKILINGLPLEVFDKSALRRGISFVSADAFLFNFSIRDNITLGGEYSQDEIEAAAKIAGIHDFIARLPNGYNTVVGERGTKLSDGERQRIALARAIIRKPKIIILDEATSGVDSKTEAQIYEKLRELKINLIVVAHRLSTIYMADLIIVLDNGKIVCEGKHSELLVRCPVYRTIFEKQLIKEREL